MKHFSIVFRDGDDYQSIPIDEFSLPLHVVIRCENQADAISKWNLISTNLPEMQVFRNDQLLMTFERVGVDGVQFMMDPEDAGVTLHIYMSERPEPLPKADPEEADPEEEPEEPTE